MDIFTLFGRIVLDSAGAERGLDDLEKKTERNRRGMADYQKTILAVGAAAAALGAGIEALARSQAAATQATRRLAVQTGITEGEMRTLIAATASVDFGIREVAEVMEVATQRGVRGAAALQQYARTWDLVADAIQGSAADLARQAVGLEQVGIGIENQSDALDALGFVQRNTTAGLEGFLTLIERRGPAIRRLGLDVNDAAAFMGILENEIGLTGLKARQEFERAINDSDGTLQGLLQTMGISIEMFQEYQSRVSGSAVELEKLAAANNSTFTPIQRLQSLMERFVFTQGENIEKLANIAPLLIAIGLAAPLAASGLTLVSGAMTRLGISMALVGGPVGIIALIAALGAGVLWMGKMRAEAERLNREMEITAHVTGLVAQKNEAAILSEITLTERRIAVINQLIEVERRQRDLTEDLIEAATELGITSGVMTDELTYQEQALIQLTEGLDEVRSATDHAAEGVDGLRREFQVLAPRTVAAAVALEIMEIQANKSVPGFIRAAVAAHVLATGIRSVGEAAALQAQYEGLIDLVMRAAGVMDDAGTATKAYREQAERAKGTTRDLTREMGELARVAAQIRSDAERGVETLGRALVGVLRTQEQEALDRQLRGIALLRDAYMDQHNARMSAIAAERDGALAAIDDQIDALTQQGADVRDQRLREQLALAIDPRERQRIQDQIADIERQASIAQLRTVRNEVTEESRIRERAAQDDLAAQMAAYSKQEEEARSTFNRITEAWRLESRARELIMNNELDEIESMIESHMPGWLSHFQSFASQVIDGPIASIRSALDSAMSMLGGGGAQGTGINPNAAAIMARNEQGESLAARGVPAIVLSSLRNSIAALGGIPSFDLGGVVPGPVGSAQLVMAHGGETILPTHRESITPQVNLTFADGMGWLKDFVRVEIERDTQWQQGTGARIAGGI